MNIRLGWFAATSLFTAAAALIYAGHPLVAAVLLMGVSYLAGRWDRRRDRLAVVARLRSERNRAVAKADRLQDHLTFHYDCQHLGQFADDAPPSPDLRDRPDWASIDRKPDTTTAQGASLPHTSTSNP